MMGNGHSGIKETDEHTTGMSSGSNPPSDRSFSDLIRGVISNLQNMIRSEVSLAKAELREEAGKAMAGAKSLGIAAVLGLYAGGFLLAALCMFLATIMPGWAAALAVGLVLGLTAFVLFRSGSKAMGEVSPKPEKTIASVKENVAWLKNQTK